MYTYKHHQVIDPILLFRGGRQMQGMLFIKGKHYTGKFIIHYMDILSGITRRKSTRATKVSLAIFLGRTCILT